MPGDPNNPFNDILSQLNGATFASAVVSEIKGQASLVGDQLEVDGVGAGFQFHPEKIIVDRYNYYPGSYQGYGKDYKMPYFGSLKFSDNSNKSYTISGFSKDGILLSTTSAYIGYATHASRTGFYILSLDGFSTDNFDFPVTFGYDASVFQLEPVCFTEGTRIETIDGPVPVESLAIGDCVMTASGAARPVTWVGQMSVRPARHARPSEVNPVRIRAHAFGPNQPARDLRVSPGHAIYVDGVLVPAGQLVNGATIVQDAVEEVRYFHVELESHDVLLAEGLPCESYLDDGNRAAFANAGALAQLHGRVDPTTWDAACAPMVAAGPQLAAIQQRLLARAEDFGWVRSEDAELTLVADGVEIRPTRVAGNRYRFALPAAADIRLRSTSSVLAQMVAGLGDARRLGVAVSRCRVDGAPIELASACFGAGFYPEERHGEHGWRWSNGAATLRLPAGAATLDIELAMIAPSWRHAPLRIAA